MQRELLLNPIQDDINKNDIEDEEEQLQAFDFSILPNNISCAGILPDPGLKMVMAGYETGSVGIWCGSEPGSDYGLSLAFRVRLSI